MAKSPDWTDEEVQYLAVLARKNPSDSLNNVYRELLGVGPAERSPNSIRFKLRALRKTHDHLFPRTFCRYTDNPNSALDSLAPAPVQNIGTLPEVPSIRNTDPVSPQSVNTDDQLRKLINQMQALLVSPDGETGQGKSLASPHPPDVMIHDVTGEAPQLWAITSDWHVPHHDPRMVATFIDFVRDVQPAGIILNGDLVDTKSVGSFEGAAESPTLGEADVPILKSVLQELRAAAGDECHIYYRPGNHEDRIVRPRFRMFRGLNDFGWASWLGLDSLGIKWVDYGQTLEIGKRVEGQSPLVVIHGTVFRKSAGASVKGHMTDHGFFNVVMGHCHRLGVVHKRMRERVVWGVEGGGFFDRRQLNYKPYSDWQEGFALVTIDPLTSNSFPTAVSMSGDGSFAHGGKVYGTRQR